MARVLPFKNSGNAGEISPRLHARTDFTKYPNAVEVGLNVIPLPEGGLMRRPGTRFVKEIHSSSVKGRLRPFQFSTTQAYMLELGANIMHFYRHQAIISIPDTDAAFANGFFGSNITGWDDRSSGGAGNAIAHDASNGRLTLQTNGTASDDIGWAEDAIAIGASFRSVLHAVKFQVIGAPSDRIEFRVGTTSTGSELIADRLCEVGYHVVSFNPGGASTVYIQFRNRGSFRDKDVQIDNVSFIDGAGVNIQTPWPESVLYELTGPQSLDEKYFFHDDYPTYKLQRLGHTDWSLPEVAWQDGPWLTENDTATTLTFSAATGLGVTVTASAVTGINDDAGFQTTDVGRLIRLTDGTVNWGWAVITQRNSTTVVLADVRRSVIVTTAETKWRLGAWSGTTGYPSCGGFFEQRLYAANNGSKQETFWASQTSDFENHSPDSPNSSSVWNGTVEDDDALDYTLSADDAHAIRWLSPGEDTLVIGTTAGEWVPESQGAVLTPTDITVRQQTSHGSARIDPVRVGNVVLFAQKAKRKVREFGFNFETDGYRAHDMTRLAEHMTRGGLVEMGYQQEPDSLVWSVRSDGVLLSMTYRREEDVVGWARHYIGGTFNSGIAVVESVAVIPGADGSGQVQNSENRNEVWVIVKRTINGATKRYVEVFEEIFEGPIREDYDADADWVTAMLQAQTDAYYVDSCITLDSPITVTGATAADPVVVTATSHGLSNGDEIRITDVLGTDELNANSYLVGVVDANNVRLMDTDLVASISGATQANPVVITTATTHGLSTGDKVGIVGVSGMTNLNGNVYTATVLTTTTFSLGVDGSAYGAYTSGGSVYHAENGTAYTAYISGGKINKKVTAVSGLTHLEGQTLRILGDGAILPDETVSSAAVTLDQAASVAQLGLGYTHRIKTLKSDYGGQIGTAVGQPKRITGVTYVVLDSLTMAAGPTRAALDEFDFRDVDDVSGEPAPLFSGEKTREFSGDWKSDARIYVESDDPVPFTLLAMVPKLFTNDTGSGMGAGG